MAHRSRKSTKPAPKTPTTAAQLHEKARQARRAGDSEASRRFLDAAAAVERAAK